ncbi:hypothetical protein V6N11_052805 [Hibiscus sabdariffa]|uniref:Uncharacterized protein n=1 Tax=Hibiscus sabdariffa TaxID=183260 RepID=A0ABR2UB68_9ROSI
MHEWGMLTARTSKFEEQAASQCILISKLLQKQPAFATSYIYYLSPDSVFLAVLVVLSFPSHCWLSSAAFIHVHIHGYWRHYDLARFPFKSCCLCVFC